MNGLGKKRGKDSGGVLIVLLLILAVCGGAITTGLIARWADRRVAIDVTGTQPEFAGR